MRGPGLSPCGRCGHLFPPADLSTRNLKAGGTVRLCQVCAEVWGRLGVKVK